MNQIPSKRLETVLGKKPKPHAWAPQENHAPLLTVTRDQRPAIKYAYQLVTVISAGVGVSILVMASWALLFYLLSKAN